ncbi:MAG: polysaccharide biosynthesis protein [Bacteroidota bacterium]|nr:polysaccharide biosynthesis protein [Bacteroidota bacterium]
MKELAKRIGFLNYASLIEWSKLVSLTGLTQIVAQLIALVSGILIIRILPPHEYALYTLANTMLGTMVVLADGGIASAVMSQGGKVWMEHEKLGAVLVTGMQLRRKFAVVSLPLSSGILLYFLRVHGATWLFSILIVLSIIPTFFMMIHSGILEISPKLRQDINSLQKVRVRATVGRLAMLCLTLFAFPLAVIALLATSLPQLWTNIRYRKISSNYADLDQEVNPAIQKNILKMVWRMLPEAIYYCLSGQITIWLISIFGQTSSVAAIGALSRLSVVIGFFSVLFANIIAPRFARLPNDPKILLTRYLQIQAALFILCIFITGNAWIFSDQILWILGTNYKGLNKELVLMVISSCLGLFYGASFLLGTYRSWVINPILFISISLITTIWAILIMDISSLQNIIILNIIVGVVEFTMLMIFNIMKIMRIGNANVK